MMTPLSRHSLLGAAFALGMSAASARPFLTLDFTDILDGVAQDSASGYEAHLGDGVQILKDGPTGKPYALFTGASGSSARANSKKVASKIKGDEVSASFWVRLDRIGKGDIAFGYTADRPPYNQAPFWLSLPQVPTEAGGSSMWTAHEGDVKTNEWHHLAFSFSKSGRRFRAWLDGIAQCDNGIGEDAKPLRPGFLDRLPGKEFRGAIADLRVWNAAVADGELLSLTPPKAEAAAMAADFDRAAAGKGAGYAPFAAWCRRCAEKTRSYAQKPVGDVRGWTHLQAARRRLPALEKAAAEIAARPESSSLASAAILPLSIYPYSHVKRLPFLMPFDGVGASSLRIDAAKGEFESATFMAYPLGDAEDFLVKSSDLTGPGGARIPASALDVKIALAWFTTASGWDTYFAGGREFPTLSPELLVYDDDLVKVDYEKRKNFIRCSYRTGPRYIDITVRGTTENMEPFNTNLEPVHDAATLQPMQLKDGWLRQFWITAHVPSDATPGEYRGRLDFTVGGKPAGSLPVVLGVRPFRLPRASTRYNIDIPFYGAWMNHINLDGKLAGRDSLTNAVRRLRNEYRTMAEHNMIHPFGMGFSDDDKSDLAALQLRLMAETGCDTSFFFGGGSGCPLEWLLMGQFRERYPNHDISAKANPEKFQKCLRDFDGYLDRAMGGYQKLVPGGKAFFYGADEAGPGTVRREMPFFAKVLEHGGLPFITSGVAKWSAFVVGNDDCPASFGRTNARNWHEGGATVTTYAAPFSGPENPEIWRRQKGIRLYMSNFDGLAEYVWYEGWNLWNEFVTAPGISKYRNFNIVYPTRDGVLDTIPWDALREGFDDIRYLTLVRRLGRFAIQGDDRSLVRLGRRATAWAETIDPESVSLDDMRAEASRWIVLLQDALAKTKTDTSRAYE